MSQPDRLPRLAWLRAPDVVAYSLRCLDRGGPTVCIPGWRFRLRSACFAICLAG